MAGCCRVAIPVILFATIAAWNVEKQVNIIVSIARKEGSRCINLIDGTSQHNLLLRDLSRSFILSITFKSTEYNVSNCVNPLLVLFGSSSLSKLNLDKNMGRSVWLIFIDSSQSIYEMLEKVNITFDACVIIVEIDSHDHYAMNSVYRAAKGYPLKRTVYYLKDHGIERNKRNDLEGIVFRNGLVEGAPAAIYVNSTHTDGYVPTIWAMLQPQLNFTTVHTRYVGSPGSFENGRWSGVIEELLLGTFNVIVCDMSITPERKNVLDMPQGLLTTRYQVFFKQEGLCFGYSELLQPLHWHVWMVVLVWVFLGGFCVFIITKYLGTQERNLNSGWKKLGLLESVFFVLQTLCMQGSSEVPRTSTLRIIFFVSYLVSAVVLPSYSASLISSLTKRAPKVPFSRLEDIVHTKYYLYVDYKSSDYNFFTSAKSDDYQRILKNKLRDTGSHNGGVRRYLQIYENLCSLDHFAVILSGHQMKFNIDDADRKKINKCGLLELKQVLPIIHQGISFKKNSPYTNVFNLRFMQLREAGILHRERNKFWPKFEKPKKTYDEIYLHDVYTIFIIYFVGVALSFIILIYERIALKTKTTT